MASTQWAIFGALFGAAAATLLACIFWTAATTARQVSSGLSLTAPEGILHTVSALQSPALILDSALCVHAVNAAAIEADFVRANQLANPAMIECAASVRTTGLPCAADVIIPHRRGADSHYSVTVSPLGARSYLLVGTDHTKEDHIEEVRRDFMANFSHELKTPIAAALLLSEAMQQAADDPEQLQRFSDSLHDQISHLDQMVRDILELSNVESRTDRSTYQQVDVTEAVALAVDACRVAAKQRRIELSASIPDDLAIWGDPHTLVTIVENIVENAVKYSRPGGRVGIGVTHADGEISISVTDKGIGISPTDQGRIFERFYRGDKAHTTSDGTGLGLSIARHGARILGGDIAVWSRPGVGSTFTIRLPESSPELSSQVPIQGKLYVADTAH